MLEGNVVTKTTISINEKTSTKVTIRSFFVTSETPYSVFVITSTVITMLPRYDYCIVPTISTLLLHYTLATLR